MENKKTLVVGIIALVIGLIIGYYITVNWSPYNYGMMERHQMSEGQMMDNADMQSMMMDMNADLYGKTGDVFDQAFLKGMIVHHEGAVEMAKAALRDAKHQEIKTMADEIISAQAREIAQMKTWLKVWYNQ